MNTETITDSIISYESGELNDGETLELFSHLIKTGMAWSLQGHYGRTASALITDGWLGKDGSFQDKCYENDIF